MPANALVQTRIDAEVKERATEVLEKLGMTVSDAVRILLTRTANEGNFPLLPAPNSAEYDQWFRAKVREAMEDPRPPIDGEAVEAYFARRRAEVLAGNRRKG